MTEGGASRPLGRPASPSVAQPREALDGDRVSSRSIASAAAVRIEYQAPAHAAGLFAALSDPAVHEFLDGRPLPSREAWRKRIAALRKGSADPSELWLNWTVFLGDRIVGYTQATVRPGRTGLCGDLAFVLASSVWGRGAAFEACRQTISRLAKKHGVSEFVADAHVANARSARLLARLGFEEVCVIDEDRYFRCPTPQEMTLAVGASAHRPAPREEAP